MIDHKSTLLVLSRNRRNLELLTQVLEQASYQIIAVSSCSKIEEALAATVKVDLGLIDLAGCNRQIWDYCERLQAENIPFLTFTPQYNFNHRTIESDSLAHGASSVLRKPLVIRNLLLLINSSIEKQA